MSAKLTTKTATLLTKLLYASLRDTLTDLKDDLESCINARNLYAISKGTDASADSEVAKVDAMVSKAWNLFTSVKDFINDPQHSLELLSGVITPGSQSELAAKALATRLSEEDDAGFKTDEMSKQQFASYLKDAIVASIIRGMHLDLAASRYDRDLKKLFTAGRKSFNSPLQPVTPESNFAHKQANFPHPHDNLLPYSELSPSTLSVFFKKASPFASKIRSIYNVDDEHFNEKYADHLPGPGGYIDGSQLSLGESRDMDSAENIKILCVDYIVDMAVSLIEKLLGNSRTPSDLIDTFSMADTRAAQQDEGGNETMARTEVRYGDQSEEFESWIGLQPDGQGPDIALDRADDPDMIMGDKITLQKTADGKDINLTASRGKIHSKYVAAVIHKAMRTLTSEFPTTTDKFNFAIIGSEGEAVNVSEVNLYTRFYDRYFSNLSMSTIGSKLAYQLFNGGKTGVKDNIGKSVSELREMLRQLPKNPTDITMSPSQSDRIMTRTVNFNKYAGSEAVRYAVDVTNNVLKDNAGNMAKLYSNTDADYGYDSGLTSDLAALLNPSAGKVFPAFSADIKSRWGIETPNRAATLSEAVNPNAAQVVEHYFNDVKTILSSVSPDVNWGEKNSNKYPVFLYKTENNQNAGGRYSSNTRYIYDDATQWTSDIHDVMNRLKAAEEAIVDADTVKEVADLVMGCFTTVFKEKLSDIKYLIVTSGTAKLTLGSLLFPKIHVSAPGEDGKEESDITQVKAAHEIAAGRAGSNKTHCLIRDLLSSGTTYQKKRASKNTPTGVAPVKTLDNNTLAIHTAVQYLAALHSRIEFLIAITEVSNTLSLLAEAWATDILQKLPTSYVKALTDEDKLITDEDVSNAVDAMATAVAHEVGNSNAEEEMDKAAVPEEGDAGYGTYDDQFYAAHDISAPPTPPTAPDRGSLPTLSRPPQGWKPGPDGKNPEMEAWREKSKQELADYKAALDKYNSAAKTYRSAMDQYRIDYKKWHSEAAQKFAPVKQDAKYHQSFQDLLDFNAAQETLNKQYKDVCAGLLALDSLD